MKIAYHTGEYPRATDTFIQREVAGLRALGAEVVTCSVRRTDAKHHVGPEQREEAARTFHVLEAAKNPARLLAAHARLLARRTGAYARAWGLGLRTRQAGSRGLFKQLAYLAEAGVLADHLRAEGVQHLHNHFANSSCTVAMLAAEMSGVPYSVTMHGPAIFFEPGLWRVDEKVARARFVACISHYCRSQAMIFSDPAHWSKLHIVHCGVDPDAYQPTRGGGGRTELLFVGRLAAVKGLPVLIQAMEQLTAEGADARLTLIGDGPDRAALEARVAAARLSDRITFAGYQGSAEVAAALSRTDVFVLPSFAEGVPVVLMEALASQVPVVTTRIAGVGELVEDGVSGLLVPPGDAASLAEAVSALVRDEGLRRRMGEAGRAKVAADYATRAEAAWLLELMEGYHAGTAPKRLRQAEARTRRALAAE